MRKIAIVSIPNILLVGLPVNQHEIDTHGLAEIQLKGARRVSPAPLAAYS
ncbi:MAG: hypothetical protein P8M25_07905 [Paracoccaceae bacterium]|nr:hypothetical protein [Paracoccaceae bacterium]